MSFACEPDPVEQRERRARVVADIALNASRPRLGSRWNYNVKKGVMTENGLRLLLHASDPFPVRSDLSS
jgi:hypothetical protein